MFSQPGAAGGAQRSLPLFPPVSTCVSCRIWLLWARAFSSLAGLTSLYCLKNPWILFECRFQPFRLSSVDADYLRSSGAHFESKLNSVFESYLELKEMFPGQVGRVCAWDGMSEAGSCMS